MRNIWYHPYCFHENTTSISDISPTIFDITVSVSVSSHPLYPWHHNKYRSHHISHMYDIIPILNEITFTIYGIKAQYLWHHNCCIHDIRYPLYNITSTVYDISTPIPMTWHPLYLCHHTQFVFFIKPSIHMTSQPLYIWHHMHYIWHHIHSLGHHTTLFLTSHPLYLTSCPLYLSYHTHPIDDITATICMISHPVYVWHHIHISMTWYPLCMTSQNCVFMTPHSAYVWYHLHYRERHIHSITQNHSIYDVTSTSGMTSHPLYLCDHNLSKDIIPTFVWHQTHYICDII